MAVTGPIPKRSEDRIRRNASDPVEKLVVTGKVEVPELGLTDPHPLIADFYNSLPDSAQTRYYEPSDWQYARLTCHFLDKLVKDYKPSGQMLAVVSSMLTEMLVSEGARRRVRLEVERETTKTNVVSIADAFRQRMAE